MFGFGRKKPDMDWALLVLAAPTERPQRITYELLHRATERQVRRRCEIITESLDVIRRTANAQTRQNRFDLCKKHYAYLEKLTPYTDRRQTVQIRACEKAMRKAGIL